MQKVLLVALAVLIGAPVTPVLAGECDKVRSSYTRAVCNTPVLAQLNQRVEMAYEALRLRLSRKSQAEMAAGHRQWRQFARLACTPNGVVTREPYDSGGLQCLVRVITARADLLESDWVINSVQTFPVETYLAKPDPQNGLGPFVGSFSFVSTLIDGGSEEAEAFNAYVLGGYGDGGLLLENSLTEFDGGAQIELRTNVYEVTSRRISSVTDVYAYYHGAAHGNSSLTYEHFLVKEKRRLEAGDIFAGSDWQQQLIALIKNCLRTEPQLSETIWDDLGSVDIVATDPTRWRFTSTGMEFQFQPYEITPYAYGLPAIELKWNELDGLLQDALVIAGSV